MRKPSDVEVAEKMLAFFQEMARIKQNDDAFMARISKSSNITEYDQKLLSGMKIKLPDFAHRPE